MIRRILVCILLAIVSLGAYAQLPMDACEDTTAFVQITANHRNYVFSIGPKAGLNYSFAKNPKGINLGMGGALGYFAGLAANVRFSRPKDAPLGTECLGVQIEGLYSKRSLKTNGGSINMTAYEIPIVLQWYFTPQFFVETGASITGVVSTSPERLIFYDTVYQTGGIKANDVMLAFGVGYKAKSGLYANLRYNKGNSNLANNLATRVSVVTVSMGWLFSIVN